MALASISGIYSDETKKALDKVNQIESNKPGEYQSQYSNVVSNLLDKITNREAFSYDFNADPLYQQYKDNYTSLGKQAMMDTVAAASTMTGGYGNSYATTAGAQANQQYLQALNDKIPDLWNMALNRYAMETEDLYNKFSAVGAQDDREYGRYRDNLADWQTDRDYYYGKYNTSLGNDQYVTNYNYQEARDKVADDQWNTQFEYQKSRDAVADDQWNKQYALQLAARQAAASGGSSSGGSSESSDSGSSYSQASVKSGTVYTTPTTATKAGTTTKVVNTDTTVPQKIANMIANNSGTKNAANYLANEVNAGRLTTGQATSILNNTASKKTLGSALGSLIKK